MNGEGVLLASGGVYTGPLQHGMPEGVGHVEWPQRPRSAASYSGSLQRGVRSGRGELVTTEDIRFVGDFKDNMRHGDGVHTLNGRVRFEGSFVNGRIHGRGSCAYENYLEYNGEFKNGVIHGEGTMRFADGATYKGLFREGVRHGQGRMTWPDGDKYSGKYCNDLRHGLGTYTWNTGQRYHGHFVHGKRNGLGVFSWPDGATFCGHFKEDRRCGPGILCHDDGSVDAGLWDGAQLWRLTSVATVLKLMKEYPGAHLLKTMHVPRKYEEGMLTKMSKKAMLHAQRGETRLLAHCLRRCKVHQDVSDEHGVNLVMLAACNNHTLTVEMLLDYGAAVNQLTTDGVSALNLSYHLAWGLSLDSLPYVGSLLCPDRKPPAPEDMHDTYKLLLARGADPDASTFPSPVLVAAVNNADVAMCRILIGGRCSANIIDPKDHAQQTPVLRVARSLLHHDIPSSVDDTGDLLQRRLTIMRLLLEAGTQINKADAAGATVLHALASVSLPDAAVLISEIIERGAAVDQLDDEGYTPLARAVIAGSISNMEALLKHGADPNVHVGPNNDLPIHLAITAHTSQDDDQLRYDLVDLLLHNGADPTFAVPVVVERGQVSLGTVMDSATIHIYAIAPTSRLSKRLSTFDGGGGTQRHRRRLSTSSSFGHNTSRRGRASIADGTVTETDLRLCERLTTAMRNTLLTRQSFNDIELCAQCGRSYKQRLMPFSGSAHIFFCGERCKMRALNGDHRKALLASLKSTDPQRWKFLQLADEPHLVWRGDTISEVERAVTAPPDYNTSPVGKAIRRRRKSGAVASEEMQQASVVSRLTPVPSLSKPLPNARSLASMQAQKQVTFSPSHSSHPAEPRRAREKHKPTVTVTVTGPSRAVRVVERAPLFSSRRASRSLSVSSTASSQQEQQQQQQQHSSGVARSRPTSPRLSLQRRRRQQQQQQQQSQQQRQLARESMPPRPRLGSDSNPLAQSLPSAALAHLQGVGMSNAALRQSGSHVSSNNSSRRSSRASSARSNQRSGGDDRGRRRTRTIRQRTETSPMRARKSPAPQQQQQQQQQRRQRPRKP